MCELFGVSSKKYVEINEYLEKFYSHSEEHPHGWGLAIMDENQSIIQKQPVKASQSEELKKLLSKPISVKNAFAHIRLATMGYMDSFNCHPFIKIDNAGRTWTLIHNGTIFEYEDLKSYVSKQLGETDSERILLYIVDQINDLQDELERKLNPEECFKLLDNIITDLSEGNKLNVMIFNGEFMYIHTNYRNSLYYLKTEDTLFISTRPLNDENWRLIPFNRVIGIKDGELAFEGKKHNHEYLITEDQLNFIMEQLSPSLRESMKNNFGELYYAKEYRHNNQ